MNRQTARQWAVLLITMIMLVGIGATWTNAQVKRTIREAQEAGQQASADALAVVCEAFISQDEVLNDPDDPPTTDRARKNARAWHELRVKFCS